MSNEKDEKFKTPELQEKMSCSSHYFAFCSGWDQALDSEAVKKLVEALQDIADMDPYPETEVSYRRSSKRHNLIAKLVLEEFNKAKEK